MATRNLPTFLLPSGVVGPRQAELPQADFVGGMNRGGSNAGGIGVNTGDYNPKLTDWTTETQTGGGRFPQNTQYLGGSALGDGDQFDYPLLAADYEAGEFNDELGFVVAAQDTAPDAGLGLAGSLPTNRTGATVPEGARCWGTADF